MTNYTTLEMLKFYLSARLDFEPRRGLSFPENRRWITCKDGTTLSVQAGNSQYCTPRKNNGPWTHVEVGFPSKRLDQLMPYIDGSENSNPMKSVYGWVPLEIVAAAIDECGGIVA